MEAPPKPPAVDLPREGPKYEYNGLDIGQDIDVAYGSDTQGIPKNRRSGVILHPTSLPGPYGTGEIGKEAYRFVDWLASAGMQIWQVLPLGPPETQFWSPYSGTDALCGHPLMIPLEELVSEGLMDSSELPPKTSSTESADFNAVNDFREPLLVKVADRLLGDSKHGELRKQMDAFRTENAWVEDSALFFCLANLDEVTKDSAWWTWPEELRFRQPQAVSDATSKFKQDIDRFVTIQFLFDKYWKAVKAYANSKGVRIMGDMPIYVGGQSADVWANQELFELGKDGAPLNVSGVPPDAFSETGQLWGSPLYDWKAQQKVQYSWWVRRLGRAFQLYDETRIDHFRGFAGYWSVDAKADTAMNGVWKKGPGTDIFQALEKALGEVPIVAEDLGVITPDVHVLREAIGAPGMVVLQFAWGGGYANTHLPHNHYENSVVYPGTHDNETVVGWWQGSANEGEKAYFKEYLGVDGKDPAWALLKESLKSVSQTAIMLMQDVMRLDNSGRMNHPGTTDGNWAWRVGSSDVWSTLDKEAKGLRHLNAIFDRLPPGVKE